MIAALAYIAVSLLLSVAIGHFFRAGLGKDDAR